MLAPRARKVSCSALIATALLLQGCEKSAKPLDMSLVPEALKHSTDFLSAGCLTHMYAALDGSERKQCLARMVARGYKHFYIYAYNEGDYKKVIENPAFDFYATPNAMVELLNEIREAGLAPVVWLFPDDSEDIHNTDVAKLKAKLGRLIPEIDAQVSSYVLGLELDEYWGKSTVNALGEHLDTLTDKLIGVHHTDGKWNFASADWVDYLVLQYGFLKKDETAERQRERVEEMTRNAWADLAKPVVAGEYWDLNQPQHGGVFLGDAAMRSGAVGFGNGGTP